MTEREVDRARRAAYDLLHAVGADDAYANLALPAILAEHDIQARDAAFATELSFSTLRWRGFLDEVLAQCVDRPLDRLDPQIHDILRLGACQLLLMRVPSHAAVSETVQLARQVRGEGASKLANAVLRKVGARTFDEWTEVITRDVTDDSQRLARRWSHPVWIVNALREALADETEVSRSTDADSPIVALLSIDNQAPEVTLVARPGLCSREELLALDHTRAGAWSPFAVVLESGNPAQIDHVRRGRAAVQDEGSQLVALALANAPLDGPDSHWLDLCAGPGGKAALLGSLAAERGARVMAVEPIAHRAELVRRTVRDLPVDVIEADGRLAFTEPAFDRVLVDAPCTGLGVIRRRAEARWRRTAADVGTLAALQRELLSAGIAAARPGGLVLYSTCSPHLAETEQVVADVIRKVGGVERVPISLTAHSEPSLDARLWPHIHGTDGMYAALLRRV